MNHLVSSLHRRLVRMGFAVALPLVAAGCAHVQSYSFQTAASPDRLPELAYDEVRRGSFADHRDLLGPVQVELGPRAVAEFPVILEKGRCYRAIAADEERHDKLRIALLGEDFQEQDAVVGRNGSATIQRCPERTENLILSVEGATQPVRVVVGVLLQP